MSETRCPGCSRHCREGRERCKYGLKHFKKAAKMRQKTEKTERVSGKPRKWERHVQRGELLWQLLWVASLSKRALRDKKIDEAQLLALLDEREREQLHQLLKKLVEQLVGGGELH